MMDDKLIVLDGHFVSERISQIIQAIREYSPELDVQWVPPPRPANVAAFKIIHRPVGKPAYTIFHVKNEDEFDARVLKRIIAGDQRNGVATYSEIEAAEKAAELIAKERYKDAQAEMIDKMYHVFKSPLNTYRLDKDTIIKDGIPFNAKGY